MKENVTLFNAVAKDLCRLHEQKNKCYGNSFGETYRKLGIISAITRISDKYNRLCTLATNPQIDNMGESIKDTLLDLAAYAIMTFVEYTANEKTTPETKQCKCDCKCETTNKGWNETHPILVGDKFRCTKQMASIEGKLSFIQGRTYTSVQNGTIADEKNTNIFFTSSINNQWNEYFERIPHIRKGEEFRCIADIVDKTICDKPIFYANDKYFSTEDNTLWCEEGISIPIPKDLLQSNFRKL